MDHQGPPKKSGNSNINKDIDTTNPIISSSCYYGESFSTSLNLSALNGLRCFTSFSVIALHVHMIHGIAYYLSYSTCYANVYQSFIGFWLVRPSYQMAIFWMISGFLCEYQLHNMYKNAWKKQQQIENNKDKKNQISFGGIISIRQYIIFFVNRLLRLYPLYFLLAVWSYISLKPVERDFLQYRTYDLITTLLFIKQWTFENTNVFAGVSWSVEVDVHGYLAIMILFALTSHFTYHVHDNTMEKRRDRTYLKRMIIVGWYAVSQIHMSSYRPMLRESLSFEGLLAMLKYGGFGIERSNGKRVAVRDIYLGKREEIYPHFEFDSPWNLSLVNFTSNIASNTYFGGIFNHGVAMMLGSLLYLNLYVRNGEPSSPTKKLLYFFFGILVTQGWYGIAGIPIYFLMDAVLTMKPDNCNKRIIVNNEKDKKDSGLMSIRSHIELYNQKAQSMMLTFLSYSIFTKLSEYTYGIYLFHMPFIAVLEYYHYKDKIAIIKSSLLSDGVDDNEQVVASASCDALKNAGYQYDIIFVIKVSLICFTAGLIISIIMNIIVERPINRLRKRFLPKST